MLPTERKYININIILFEVQTEEFEFYLLKYYVTENSTVQYSTIVNRMPILDLVPKKLHERSPIFLGSKEDVDDIMEVIAKHKAEN